MKDKKRGVIISLQGAQIFKMSHYISLEAQSSCTVEVYCLGGRRCSPSWGFPKAGAAGICLCALLSACQSRELILEVSMKHSHRGKQDCDAVWVETKKPNETEPNTNLSLKEYVHIRLRKFPVTFQECICDEQGDLQEAAHTRPITLRNSSISKTTSLKNPFRTDQSSD